MALGATIFRLELHVADMVRGYYGSHALTLARHPSETDERMMLRVLMFALYADEHLAFTRGLSTAEEPALWRKDLTGDIHDWIDLGHPEARRLLQAGGKSNRVIVCCYGGHASQVWWRGIQGGVRRLRNLTVLAVEPAAARAMAQLARRTMSVHVSIDEGSALVSSEQGSIAVEIAVWH